jgi:RNA polymerase sigma-70 factor (ECF subfamily)
MKNPHRPAVAQSEGGWFESSYKKYSPILYKFIAKRLGKDEATVEEIFEETMVAGWKGYRSFEHKSSYFTWLCRIALNKIADYYHDQVNSRSKWIVPLLDSITDIDSHSLSPIESLSLKELKESVNDCLNLLPTEKRQLLWFRYWQDLSYAEISKLMGISERAVEGQLYRAKHEFAKVWAKDFKK